MLRQLTTGYLIGAELQGPVVITVICLCMLDEEGRKWKEVRTTNGTRVIHHSIISEFRGYLQRFQVADQCSDESGDMRLCFSDGPMTALLGFTADEFCKVGHDHHQHLQAEMVDKLHIIKVRLSPYYHIGCQYEVITLWQYQ
ncbi:hypothetical protein LINGRAHAP2_LOCUS37424 [Linum grandiflorum]